MDYYQNGKLIKVETLAKSITKEFPLHQFAWKILGAVFKQTGRVSESLIFMQESVKLNPHDAEAHNNLGVTLQELGRLKEAEASYIKATTLQTNYIEAHNNLGNTLKDQGKFDKAIAAYDKVISINPNYAEAYYNMGLIFKLLGKLEKSVEFYTKAINLNPKHSDAYNNMANVLKEVGKTKEAIDIYRKALLLNPDHAETYNNLGGAFKDIGQTDEAIKAYKKSILLNSNYAHPHNNMGNIYKEQGKVDEAIDSYKKALLINPDYADAHNNIGNLFKEQGKVDEAVDSFKKALLIKPDYSLAHKNLSFALLNQGRLKEGLNEYEWRLKTDSFKTQLRYFSQPMWDGEKSLKGKTILIWCEQGIGDTINWSFYLPLLNAQAMHCILECQRKLVPLLQRSFPNVEVRPENRRLDIERDDFDFHLPIGSLYKNLIKEISSINKNEAYLIPNSERVNYWRKKLKSLGKGPYIGISWKSSNMSPERLPDFTKILEWSPIFRIPDVTFINLQYKDYAEDLIKIKNKLGVLVHNFNDIDHYDDIDDVAALCGSLDIVVSTKLTIPFISSGVGTLTKLAVWRQSSSNNELLNPPSSAVHKYERNTWETWENVFNLISRDILKEKLLYDNA